VPESDKEVLRESFGMFVQFAFEISRRIEVLVELHCEGKSPFFQWMFEVLLEGAKVLKGKGVMPEKKTLSTIFAIGEFDEVFDVFMRKNKKGAGSKEGRGSTPTTSTAEKTVVEKAIEKKEPAEKLETPAEKREQAGKLDKEMEERLDKAFEKHAGNMDKELEARLREAFERLLTGQNNVKSDTSD
jgi:hypothetical protein